MLLAVNYSTQAAKLLAEGRIEIDRFKAPDWPDLIAQAVQYCPVAVHFDIEAGGPNPISPDWAKVDLLCEETGTRYVNLHLAPFARDYPGIPVETPEGRDFQRVRANMRRDIDILVDRYGPENVIVENIPYKTGGKFLRPSVIPDVFSELLEETGAGMLLDISHARIAAQYLGMEGREYMQRLPVHRLRELHFAGIHIVDGVPQDHLSVLDADWIELEWVLERIYMGEWAKPHMLAFEYGGVGEKMAWRSEESVIAEQVPRLREKIRDRGLGIRD